MTLTPVSGQQFQSTSPARGTTFPPVSSDHLDGISIHVPREGDDSADPVTAAASEKFQSTSPARGTTTLDVSSGQPRPISIHVPREGDDGMQHLGDAFQVNFNPRPPRGGRPLTQVIQVEAEKFQSTSPARGTTQGMYGDFSQFPISIHVPREGDD